MSKRPGDFSTWVPMLKSPRAFLTSRAVPLSSIFLSVSYITDWRGGWRNTTLVAWKCGTPGFATCLLLGMGGHPLLQTLSGASLRRGARQTSFLTAAYGWPFFLLPESCGIRKYLMLSRSLPMCVTQHIPNSTTARLFSHWKGVEMPFQWRSSRLRKSRRNAKERIMKK